MASCGAGSRTLVAYALDVMEVSGGGGGLGWGAGRRRGTRCNEGMGRRGREAAAKRKARGNGHGQRRGATKRRGVAYLEGSRGGGGEEADGAHVGRYVKQMRRGGRGWARRLATDATAHLAANRRDARAVVDLRRAAKLHDALARDARAGRGWHRALRRHELSPVAAHCAAPVAAAAAGSRAARYLYRAARCRSSRAVPLPAARRLFSPRARRGPMAASGCRRRRAPCRCMAPLRARRSALGARGGARVRAAAT
ncbi:hypothetical protein FGB62_321g011 [Gracilaria domingensis]|nr:hypothetical protein FGB62_321g011 [Gracilaria domingensis]